MTVYLDLVMALNFLVDLLLLYGAGKLSGFPVSWSRLLSAALLGAVYGGVCMLRSFRFLGNPLWRVVSLGLVAVLAYGWGRKGWMRACLFTVLSFALGGLARSVGSTGVLPLMLAGVGLWGLCRFGCCPGATIREYVPVKLRYGCREQTVLALRDTGNLLRDPITGEGVLVLSGEVACRLTGLTEEQLRFPLDTMLQPPIPGLRLVPYRAVGCSSGMLLGLRFDGCTVDGKRCSPVVAFAPEGLEGKNGYQALTGGV